MLAGGSERFIEIAEGHAGSMQTLERMRGMILASDPLVDATAKRMQSWSPAIIFEWVRQHMLYMPDFNNGLIIEEIKTPGYLLTEIERFGRAMGDCDDYVVLLGAVYFRQGHSVILKSISRHDDTLLDHVYLSVDGVPADGIVADPFGWEVPSREVTYRMDLPV
jgi:hypothetical protein